MLVYHKRADFAVQEHGAKINGHRLTEKQRNCEILLTRIGHKFTNYTQILDSIKHKCRPKQITDLIDLVGLTFNEQFDQRRQHKSIYTRFSQKSQKNRLIRAEFAQIIRNAMQAIFHYFDVKSSKLGFTNAQGKWINISYKTLSTFIGCTERQIKYFFKLLKSKHYVTTKRNYHMDEQGRKIALPSTKTIHMKLIKDTFGDPVCKKIRRYRDLALNGFKKVKNRFRPNYPKKATDYLNHNTNNVVSAPAYNPYEDPKIKAMAVAMFDADKGKSRKFISDFIKDIVNNGLYKPS